MKKFLSALLACTISSAFFMTAYAAPEIKAAENLLITAPVTEDAYFAGGNTKIDSEVKGDLYVAGGQVVINNNIGGDLVIAGGKVAVMGNVEGDLRVLGGDVTLLGNVKEDLIALGGNVTVGNKSVIGGSMVVAIGSLIMDGDVKGGMQGALGVLTMGGKVEKDVIISVQDKMNFTPTAKIMGALKYSSMIETVIPAGVVGGAIEFNKFEGKNNMKFDKDTLLKELTYSYIIYKVVSFLGALLLLLILVLMCPNMLAKFGEGMKGNGVKAFGVGLLTIILTILGSLLLMATIVGIPVALILLVALFVSFYVAKIFASLWIASYLFSFAKKKGRNIKVKLFFATGLILLLYYIVGIIPIIGWLITFVLFLVGLGGLVLMKKNTYEYLKGRGVV